MVAVGEGGRFLMSELPLCTRKSINRAFRLRVASAYLQGSLANQGTHLPFRGPMLVELALL